MGLHCFSSPHYIVDGRSSFIFIGLVDICCHPWNRTSLRSEMAPYTNSNITHQHSGSTAPADRSPFILSKRMVVVRNGAIVQHSGSIVCYWVRENFPIYDDMERCMRHFHGAWFDQSSSNRVVGRWTDASRILLPVFYADHSTRRGSPRFLFVFFVTLDDIRLFDASLWKQPFSFCLFLYIVSSIFPFWRGLKKSRIYAHFERIFEILRGNKRYSGLVCGKDVLWRFSSNFQEISKNILHFSQISATICGTIGVHREKANMPS